MPDWNVAKHGGLSGGSGELVWESQSVSRTGHSLTISSPTVSGSLSFVRLCLYQQGQPTPYMERTNASMRQHVLKEHNLMQECMISRREEPAQVGSDDSFACLSGS